VPPRRSSKEGLRNVAAGAPRPGLQARNREGRQGGRRVRSKAKRERSEDKAQIAQVRGRSLRQDASIGEVIADASTRSARTAPSRFEESNTFGIRSSSSPRACSSTRATSRRYFVTEPRAAKRPVLDEALCSSRAPRSRPSTTWFRVGEGHGVGKPLLIIRDTGRGHGHARREQDPAHLHVRRRQAPRIRERRTRRCSRTWPILNWWTVISEEIGLKRSRHGSTFGIGASYRRHQRTPRPSSTAADPTPTSRRVPNQARDRGHRLGLGPREAPGAPRQARRRSRDVKVGAAPRSSSRKRSTYRGRLERHSAAIDEGIVAGGGTALVRSRKAVEKLIETIDR